MQVYATQHMKVTLDKYVIKEIAIHVLDQLAPDICGLRKINDNGDIIGGWESPHNGDIDWDDKKPIRKATVDEIAIYHVKKLVEQRKYLQ